MKRWLIGLALTLGLMALPLPAAEKDERTAKLEALKALNDYVGDWNGTGGPPRAKPGSKDFWSEKVSWGWRFKGDDVWLHVKIKDGKYFQGGDMRYLPAKKKYELTLIDQKDRKQVYVGEIKDEVFTLERTDTDTKDTYRLTMNLAGDGVRLIYKSAKKPAGRTLYTPQYEVACNKVGESLGAKERKNLCIVTGGLGTSTVTYKGQTYYVCCSGCRDAFNDNPEKFIKEFEAKKGK
jgi:YHS domain